MTDRALLEQIEIFLDALAEVYVTDPLIASMALAVERHLGEEAREHEKQRENDALLAAD